LLGASGRIGRVVVEFPHDTMDRTVKSPRLELESFAGDAGDERRRSEAQRFRAELRESESSPSTATCTRCGEVNDPDVIRCAGCGDPMSVAAAAPVHRGGPVQAFGRGDAEVELSAPFADPLIGVVVAERYRILELLGRGGMGIVYKVEHIRIGKLLAMKLLTGELSQSAEVVRRFKLEALTASKLSSPNTVQVFDFGVSDGLSYLVMELLGGDDLSRILRAEGAMPFKRLGPIVVQICNSLAEAHENGIVHRDVKPENVILLRTREGADIAKVLDFGLAKIRESSELNDTTSHGAIVGTPYYMAPEQVRGDPVDPRTDVYALGALMYRAITGSVPFNGMTPMAVLTKHLVEAPVPPVERAPDLGIAMGVSAVVMRALAKSPADRFQRIEELREALIEQIRAEGSAPDELFDVSALRSKVASLAPPALAATTVQPIEIATRDEVEAYERTLRRRRWGAYLASFAVLVAGGVLLSRALVQRPRVFEGVEVEPNDAAPEATLVPWGRAVEGVLGKRIDANTADRDFYAIEVPPEPSGADPALSLTTTAIPNFAMCTFLYRQGLATQLAQYCVGRTGRALAIPALKLPAGRYLVQITQDRDSYGGPLVPVHENVSDPYRFELQRVTPERDVEVEPNDQLISANVIEPGARLKAALAWARDEDVFCAAKTAYPVRFVVSDVQRDAGAVVEVTPRERGGDGAPVRIHVGKGKVSASDVMTPWRGTTIAAASEDRCVRVRMTSDPWMSGAAPTPPGSSERYAVSVERIE